MTERRNFAAKFHSLFNIFMAALYLLAGILLIFGFLPFGLPDLNRRVIALALILYSGFRWYKIFNQNAREEPLKNEQ